MDNPNEHWMLGCGSYCINADADVDDLLNDAGEWLECARAIAGLLTDTVRASGPDQRRRTLFALQAIDMLALMSGHCAVHAHARMNREIV